MQSAIFATVHFFCKREKEKEEAASVSASSAASASTGKHILGGNASAAVKVKNKLYFFSYEI